MPRAVIIILFFLVIVAVLVSNSALSLADETSPTPVATPSPVTWPPAGMPPPPNNAMYETWVIQQASQLRMAAGADQEKQIEAARIECEEFLPQAIKHVPGGIMIGMTGGSRNITIDDLNLRLRQSCASYEQLKQMKKGMENNKRRMDEAVEAQKKQIEEATAAYERQKAEVQRLQDEEVARQNSPEGIMSRACEDKVRIAAFNQEIADERKVAARSGYVDKRIIHDATAAIIDYEKDIEALKKLYKATTGKVLNLSQCPK